MSQGPIDKTTQSTANNPPPDPKPDPKPDIITAPSISDGPKPQPKEKTGAEREADEKANKAPQQAKDASPEGDKKKKSPGEEMLDMMKQMVEDINKAVTDAVTGLAKKGIDAAANTETGKALKGLKDAVSDKVSELAGDLKGKISDKFDEGMEAFKQTPVGDKVFKAVDAISSAKDTIKSLPDMVSDKIIDAIQSATTKVQNIGKTPEVSMEDLEVDEAVDEQEVDDTETLDMSSPESTSTEPMSMANEAFGSMEDWNDLFEETPTKQQPAPVEESTDSLGLK